MLGGAEGFLGAAEVADGFGGLEGLLGLGLLGAGFLEFLEFLGCAEEDGGEAGGAVEVGANGGGVDVVEDGGIQIGEGG